MTDSNIENSEITQSSKDEQKDDKDLFEKGEKVQKWVTNLAKPIPLPGENDHPLEHKYSFWFTRKPEMENGKTKRNLDSEYMDLLQLIGSFASVEQFWAYYSHMMRPHELLHPYKSNIDHEEHKETGCDYHMFKFGLAPMWEQKENRSGGKHVITIECQPSQNHVVSAYWENILLAIIGEQFMVGDEICGAVVAMRHKGQAHRISVWNKSAKIEPIKNRIREVLIRLQPHEILHGGIRYSIDYRDHLVSYKHHSQKKSYVSSGSKTSHSSQQPPFYGPGDFVPRGRGGRGYYPRGWSNDRGFGDRGYSDGGYGGSRYDHRTGGYERGFHHGADRGGYGGGGGGFRGGFRGGSRGGGPGARFGFGGGYSRGGGAPMSSGKDLERKPPAEAPAKS